MAQVTKNLPKAVAQVLPTKLISTRIVFRGARGTIVSFILDQNFQFKTYSNIDEIVVILFSSFFINYDQFS